MDKQTEKKRALIVDDDASIIALYSAYLTNLGFDVAIAFDGEEAIEIMRSRKVDLVLMDYIMPKMDGIETIKLIRQYEAENQLSPTTVISVTASDSEKLIAKLRSVGTDEILVKPLNKIKFFEIIEKLDLATSTQETVATAA